MASRPARPAWQPDSIDNLVLQAGPAAAAAGNEYPQIATRAGDPAPLSTSELARVIPPGYGGPEEVSPDCAWAVRGRPSRGRCGRRAAARCCG